MYNHLLYFSYWLVNSAVLYVASLLFPGNVVLGNWRFGALEAAIYAGFCVTFFVWVLWDFAMAKTVKFDAKIVTFGYFWSANILSFWLVSRFPRYAGFGMSDYVWALLVAFIAYFAQRLAFKLVTKRGK